MRGDSEKEGLAGAFGREIDACQYHRRPIVGIYRMHSWLSLRKLFRSVYFGLLSEITGKSNAPSAFMFRLDFE